MTFSSAALKGAVSAERLTSFVMIASRLVIFFLSAVLGDDDRLV